MNKGVKLGPDYTQKQQPRGLQDQWFYGGYQQILYNPYLKPIFPTPDPKVVVLANPREPAGPVEAQVYGPNKVAGTLTSRGKRVKSRRQAIAIALSEARKSK